MMSSNASQTCSWDYPWPDSVKFRRYPSTDVPFCNFCYHAGRADFDNHRTRNRDGKLTCKYLASICCSGCGEKGHTIKYCRAKKVDNTKQAVKDGEWVGVGSGNGRGSAGIKKSSRRSEPNVAMISNVLGGAFSALVVEDDEEVSPSSPTEKCQEVKMEVVDTSNHTKLVGNDGATVTITWATKSKPVDLFQEFKNSERRSWADMVDDD